MVTTRSGIGGGGDDDWGPPQTQQTNGQQQTYQQPYVQPAYQQPQPVYVQGGELPEPRGSMKIEKYGGLDYYNDSITKPLNDKNSYYIEMIARSPIPKHTVYLFYEKQLNRKNLIWRLGFWGMVMLTFAMISMYPAVKIMILPSDNMTDANKKNIVYSSFSGALIFFIIAFFLLAFACGYANSLCEKLYPYSYWKDVTKFG